MSALYYAHRFLDACPPDIRRKYVVTISPWDAAILVFNGPRRAACLWFSADGFMSFEQEHPLCLPVSVDRLLGVTHG